MVLKYQIAPHDDDVITCVTSDWANPARFESALPVYLEKCICKDVTRSRRKKHPIGQPPLFNGIALSTWCTTLIHNQPNLAPSVKDTLRDIGFPRKDKADARALFPSAPR